eukprot:TRINITY_DN3177_c1_g1_i1.p1 TRINITY_DN3177_c1_g1~~TRINITY_DN3177_c1_g1_i1.p1  ORF type:complete len:281 (+),score=69.51 TRINITY_DN3177_c1_g1_i1:529-1371(+)
MELKGSKLAAALGATAAPAAVAGRGQSGTDESDGSSWNNESSSDESGWHEEHHAPPTLPEEPSVVELPPDAVQQWRVRLQTGFRRGAAAKQSALPSSSGARAGIVATTSADTAAGCGPLAIPSSAADSASASAGTLSHSRTPGGIRLVTTPGSSSQKASAAAQKAAEEKMAGAAAEQAEAGRLAQAAAEVAAAKKRAELDAKRETIRQAVEKEKSRRAEEEKMARESQSHAPAAAGEAIMLELAATAKQLNTKLHEAGGEELVEAQRQALEILRAMSGTH